MDMKQRRKGALVTRQCDLCGSFVDERDLVMSEVQGLRGSLVCSAHPWEREARVKPSFQDRGGVGQVPDLSIDPIWPGGKDYPGGAQTLVRFVHTVSGGNSYAATSGNVTNLSNGDLTVEALVFIATGSALTPRAVANNADFLLGRGWFLAVTHTGTDPLFNFGGDSVASLDGLVTPNVLHRITATKSSAGDVVLYVDGVSTATDTVTTTTQTYAAPLAIAGNDASSNASAYAVGDLRVFNVVRTPTEIAASWNVLLPPNTTGLVANYQTVEGSGDQLQDACGGENMTIVGGLGWTEEDF